MGKHDNPKTTKLVNQCSSHLYEVLPPSDKRGVDLISDVLPFGRPWYAEPNAVSNAKVSKPFT